MDHLLLSFPQHVLLHVGGSGQPVTSFHNILTWTLFLSSLRFFERMLVISLSKLPAYVLS